jgi:hypothetical protein
VSHQYGARLYTRDIPALRLHEAAPPQGTDLVIARGDAPVFYYHRKGAGVVAHTRMVHRAAPFADYRLAKIFAEFWMRCDPTLGDAYLVER